MRTLWNKVMTELEKDDHLKLLHGEMEAYTNCLTVNKNKLLGLLDEDEAKLNVKLVKARQYHKNKVSEIEHGRTTMVEFGAMRLSSLMASKSERVRDFSHDFDDDFVSKQIWKKVRRFKLQLRN